MQQDVNLQRGLRQHLESLRSSGLTHVPASVDTHAKAGSVLANAPADGDDAAGALRASSDPRRLLAEIGPQPEESTLMATQTRSTLAREQRCEKLAAVAKGVAACTRCQALADKRTQTVFGVGDVEARVMFIGEAPGAEEDRQGEPFVGAAGQMLNRIIEACKMKREEIYICNILKCRPPENRNPTTDEAENCREYLDAQIEIVDPDYIVCWGTVAAQNLLNTTTSIGRLRGSFTSHGRAKVLCTYHPSYLLRTPSAKKKVWEDMQVLMGDMGMELP